MWSLAAIFFPILQPLWVINYSPKTLKRMAVGYFRPLYPNLRELTVLYIRDEKVLFPPRTLNQSKPQIRILFKKSFGDFFGEVGRHFLYYMHDETERVITLLNYLNGLWKIISSYQEIIRMCKYQTLQDWAQLIITSGKRRLKLKGKLFQNVSNSMKTYWNWAPTPFVKVLIGRCADKGRSNPLCTHTYKDRPFQRALFWSN